MVYNPKITADIAHLITSRSIGGGRADGLGGICQSTTTAPNPYGVIGNLTTTIDGVLPVTSNNFEHVSLIISQILSVPQGPVGPSSPGSVDNCLTDSDCTADEFGILRVDDDPIANGVYQSRTSIYSAGKATNPPSEQQIVFQAGENVVLEPGFEATGGFSAEATVDFCGFDNLTSISLADGVSGANINLTPSGRGLGENNLTAAYNTANGRISIGFLVALENATCLRILNDEGKAVLVLPPLYLSRQNTFITQVEAANWPAGQYDVVLESESGILTQAIVKP